MQDIMEILKTTGKATARELAAILKVDAADLRTVLRDLEDSGQLVKEGQHWQLAELRSAPVPELAATQPATSEPVKVAVDTSAKAEPLKVLWTGHDEVQEFPTLKWVRARQRELMNEMRWLAQIENIARQIERKKGALAYFQERV